MRATTPIAIAILLCLGACASKTTSRVTGAATTPLNDLNIVRADIPEVLVDAQKGPYLMPKEANCSAIGTEIRKLDDALGPDLDAPASGDAPSLLERGTTAVENSAVGAVQRTAEGLIPFRSWVRKLTGAERYSKRVSAAITAGSVRRAFLKGVGASQSCQWGPPPQVASAASEPQP